MVGKTTAAFRCRCTDAHAPRGVSFWVELEGPGGWPSVLSGHCFRCGDQWVAPVEPVAPPIMVSPCYLLKSFAQTPVAAPLAHPKPVPWLALCA